MSIKKPSFLALMSFLTIVSGVISVTAGLIFITSKMSIPANQIPLVTGIDSFFGILFVIFGIGVNRGDKLHRKYLTIFLSIVIVEIIAKWLFGILIRGVYIGDYIITLCVPTILFPLLLIYFTRKKVIDYFEGKSEDAKREGGWMKIVGIIIQLAGLAIWILLPKKLGVLAILIGVIIILIGGLVYRAAKKSNI